MFHEQDEKNRYSHSTMYLLKPEAGTNKNTRTENSHSTMYLLKPANLPRIFPILSFTFHHVSIKTTDTFEETHSGNIFTFHHVSIKTA